jgi:hypothetical protein
VSENWGKGANHILDTLHIEVIRKPVRSSNRIQMANRRIRNQRGGVEEMQVSGISTQPVQ